MPVANESFFRDSRLKAEAEGYSFQQDGAPKVAHQYNPETLTRTANAPFVRNGGLVALRRVELAEDNTLYRFASKKWLQGASAQLLDLLNSPWWIEEERMALLLTRARTTASKLTDIARRQLALPAEWTDADLLVRVRLRKGIVLAAHAGPGRTAQVGQDRYTIARGEAPHLFIDQLYVPGLGSLEGDRSKGRAYVSEWFDESTARAFDPSARGLNP